MIKLLLKEGPESRPIKINADAASIGRAKDCTICLSDRKVSRLHAKIERIGVTYQIRDLESGNGTRVNGRRIDFHALSQGDEIRVGDTVIVVQGFDEEEDEENAAGRAGNAPVPLPQKLQVKNKIMQVKNLNSEAGPEDTSRAP